MKENKNKISTLISLIIIAILLVPVLCFAVGSDKGVKTGWTIEPRENTSSHMVVGEGVIVELSENVNKLYVYIGNVYKKDESKIDFYLDWADKPDSLVNGQTGFGHKEKSVALSKNGFHGWVLVDDDFNVSSKYVKVTLKQNVEIKEIAFEKITDKKKGTLKQVTAKCYGGKVFANNKLQFIKAEDDNNTFSNVCDEQNAFIKSGVNASNNYETKMSDAVSNLLSGKGYYVSEYDNVLGVELIALGTLIFGNNSFGLAFMPFLFFALTAFAIFAMGKKIFKNSWMGLFSSILFMLSGLPLTIATKGMSISISLFFVVMAYYFAYIFFTNSKDIHNVTASIVFMFLSGIMASLAIATNLQAVVLLPGIMFLILYPLIKAMAKLHSIYSKSSGLEKEYKREEYMKLTTRGIILSILSFVLMPIILISMCYLFAYPTYQGFYSDKNFFTMIFANHARIYNSANSSLFISWLAGFGSEQLKSEIGPSTYVTANKGMVIVSVISLVAVALTYFMVLKNKVKNNGTKEVTYSNKSEIEFLLIAFASNFFMMIAFLFASPYSTFVYSLAFLSFMPLMLIKIMQKAFGKKLFISTVIAMAVVVLFFFGLQFPCFFNIAMPQKLSAFYMWLL